MKATEPRNDKSARIRKIYNKKCTFKLKTIFIVTEEYNYND